MPKLNIVNSNCLEFAKAPVDKENKKEDIKLADKISEISQYIGKDDIFIGECIKCYKNGDLDILINNLVCKMRRSDVTVHIPLFVNENDEVLKAICQNKVGTSIDCRIKEIKDGQVFVERKSIIAERRKFYLETLKKGDVLCGKISNIDENIGVFVNIGADYTAVIPKRFLEYIYIKKITDHVSIGDTVEAVIFDLEYNSDKTEIEKVILNRLPMLPSYGELVAEYSVGDVIIAEISEFNSQSIYTKVNKHVNCICGNQNNLPLEEGKKVRVKITNVRKTEQFKMNGDILAIL